MTSAVSEAKSCQLAGPRNRCSGGRTSTKLKPPRRDLPSAPGPGLCFSQTPAAIPGQSQRGLPGHFQNSHVVPTEGRAKRRRWPGKREDGGRACPGEHRHESQGTRRGGAGNFLKSQPGCCLAPRAARRERRCHRPVAAADHLHVLICFP